MKATGIVRRIDDLGRVVIPKEIRRTMRIREGDPLEIFTASDGEVIFKKYSPLGELSETAIQFAEVLNRSVHVPVLITDRDHVIAVSGASKRDLLEQRITPEVEQLLENRTTYIREKKEDTLQPVQTGTKPANVLVPILGNGDIAGSVILLAEEDSLPRNLDRTCAQMAAAFLGKQTEV